MATKTVKRVESERAQEKKKAPEPRYLKEKLREHSIELFGVTTSTFDGAFYGQEKEDFTKDEARAIIKTFLEGGK